MAVLLRKVDSVRGKELGRQTGRRSSPMELTPQLKLVPRKRWGTKKFIYLLSNEKLTLFAAASDSFALRSS